MGRGVRSRKSSGRVNGRVGVRCRKSCVSGVVESGSRVEGKCKESSRVVEKRKESGRKVEGK